ncbi:MAG: hypothetical protein REI94_14855 [Moraxellaceae bacterium]|nr:hypothetical protein [Moraxellaceae bacterium]
MDESTSKADAYGRYAKYLPKTDDPTLVILKGHLIIEELLHSLATGHCPNPESLTKARLTFAQITYVAQALLQLPADLPWWEPVLALNKVRNSLVHELEPRAFESHLTALYGLCKPKDASELKDWKEPESLSQTARYCVLYIMGQMAAVTEVAEVLRKHFPSGQRLQRTDKGSVGDAA